MYSVFSVVGLVRCPDTDKRFQPTHPGSNWDHDGELLGQRDEDDSSKAQPYSARPAKHSFDSSLEYSLPVSYVTGPQNIHSDFFSYVNPIPSEVTATSGLSTEASIGFPEPNWHEGVQYLNYNQEAGPKSQMLFGVTNPSTPSGPEVVMQPCSSDPSCTRCGPQSCLVPFKYSIGGTQMNDGRFADPADYAVDSATIGSLIPGQSEGNATEMSIFQPPVNESTTNFDLNPIRGLRAWIGVWELNQPTNMSVIRPPASRGISVEERSLQNRRVRRRPTPRTGQGNSADKVRKLYSRDATNSQSLSAGKLLRAYTEVSSAELVETEGRSTASCLDTSHGSLDGATQDEESNNQPSSALDLCLKGSRWEPRTLMEVRDQRMVTSSRFFNASPSSPTSKAGRTPAQNVESWSSISERSTAPSGQTITFRPMKRANTSWREHDSSSRSGWLDLHSQASRISPPCQRKTCGLCSVNLL